MLEISGGYMKKIVVACLLLAGCTSQVSLDNAKPVPQDRILSFAEYNPNYAKVEITRDSGILGSACYLTVITQDNKIIARFDTSEKATVYMPEGDWMLAVAPDPQGRGICDDALGFTPPFELKHISKDKPNRFRISSRMFRRPQLFIMK